jgi:hypothetical protein
MVPVARFLLRSGVGFSEFAEVSRMAFIDVAGRDYGLRGRPTNVSRVAAMTGISRKEVKRLRSLKHHYTESLRVELSPLSDVLQRWFTDKSYLNAKGRPKALGMRGGRVSFPALVKACAGDLPVGAIRFELIRCGAISEDSRGLLHAHRRTVIPAGQDEKLVSSMVFNLRALASTIAFNTGSPNLGTAGRVEIFCESEAVPERVIGENRPVLRERITTFINGVDDFFAGLERGEAGVGRRIGVGVFYYEDD